MPEHSIGLCSAKKRTIVLVEGWVHVMIGLR